MDRKAEPVVKMHNGLLVLPVHVSLVNIPWIRANPIKVHLFHTIYLKLT